MLNDTDHQWTTVLDLNLEDDELTFMDFSKFEMMWLSQGHIPSTLEDKSDDDNDEPTDEGVHPLENAVDKSVSHKMHQATITDLFPVTKIRNAIW